MGKGKPDCNICPPHGWRPIIPDNYDVMELIFKYNSLMYDGMGAINSQAIDKILEWEDIIGDEKKIFIQKILLYLVTASQTRHEEQKDAWKRTK